MRNNIKNIYSRIQKNYRISYAIQNYDSLLIDTISNTFSILPLQDCVKYNMISSHCLFFDPLNQKQEIYLAEQNDICPIVVLNTMYNQLQKKEDRYLFAESFKKYNTFTIFEETKNYYQILAPTLIHRPKPSKSEIDTLSSTIKKYDLGIFCNNNELKQSITTNIKSQNPTLSIVNITSEGMSLLNMYQQLSECNSVLVCDNIHIAKISSDLSINTLCDKPIAGATYCSTIKDICANVLKPQRVAQESGFESCNFASDLRSFLSTIN